MNRSNNSMGLLVGLSVLLSLTAMITVLAHWPDTGRTVTVMSPARHASMMQAPASTLNVVMKDPGCHWFQTDAGLKVATSVKGPVKLMNMDEAALKIVGSSGTVIDHVGSAVRLPSGKYAITMVGDDLRGGLDTPEAYARYAEWCVRERGYPAFKLHTWQPPLPGAPSVKHDLEACAATAAELDQWDFHLAVAPVRFAGTSGSPVNPIATF